ncbi:MAG: putative phosphoglycerate mutase [Gammaproteobacteria bacterium]|nr:MAG: putative phosphoglycerate mutase [Gammaproteobacteria bacterium]TND06380.1 MAG: putative phosphoglycerate mutase [Gammaproteobacteria bacterium]
MREKEKTTQVIFVRHGKTSFPVDRVYCDDKEDPELNAEGMTHAAAAANFLQGKGVSVIYASPSARTSMTARVIADATGALVHFSEALKERPFGIWDGLYFDDIAKRFPEEYQAWKEDPVGFLPEGGESIHDLSARVGQQLSILLGRHAGEIVVLVAHVGPIRVSVARALGMPIESYRQLSVDYGSVSRVDYGKKQNNLVYLNLSLSHGTS